MKKEPIKKYTTEQILKAAEIGEVSMIDANHIVSLLDEAVTILNNKTILSKSKKKYEFLGEKCNHIMLNKILEKYNITIQQILKTPNKTIDNIFWLDYVEFTESELNIWSEWCKDFLLKNCTPTYNEAWVNSQFLDWRLNYPFKVIY